MQFGYEVKLDIAAGKQIPLVRSRVMKQCCQEQITKKLYLKTLIALNASHMCRQLIVLRVSNHHRIM